jgi:hypothetical protein
METVMTTVNDESTINLTDKTVMTMLHDHVPQSLLCDLRATDGPESAEILAQEGAPAVHWWVQ